jgi:hypothetical protein
MVSLKIKIITAETAPRIVKVLLIDIKQLRNNNRNPNGPKHNHDNLNKTVYGFIAVASFSFK